MNANFNQIVESAFGIAAKRGLSNLKVKCTGCLTQKFVSAAIGNGVLSVIAGYSPFGNSIQISWVSDDLASCNTTNVPFNEAIVDDLFFALSVDEILASMIKSYGKH